MDHHNRNASLSFSLNLFQYLKIANAFFTFRIRKIFILFIISFFPFPIFSESLSTHYIFGFDQSIGKYSADYASRGIPQTIAGILKSNGFDESKDFVSIVGYTLDLKSPSIKRYVRPYSDHKGQPILWATPSTNKISTLLKNWPANEPKINNRPYVASLQSLAKSYIAMEAKPTLPEHKADRTIIILISDEVINGVDDDYFKEWERVAGCSDANKIEFKNLEKSVFKTLSQFNEDYKFVSRNLAYNKNTYSRIPISHDGRYYATAYELVTAEKPSIHAVTDLPSPLPISKVRGGFQLSMDAKAINPKYKIEQFCLLSIPDRDTLICSPTAVGDFFISGSNLSTGDSVEVQMKLGFIDGQYNGMTLNPQSKRYSDGLTNRQQIKLSDQAYILGLIPLVDALWWWFPHDATKAVIVWDLIIILMVIAIVLWGGYKILKKIGTYTPKDSDIRITHL